MALTACLTVMSMSNEQSSAKSSYSFIRKRSSQLQAQITGEFIDKETKERLKIAIVEINGQQIKPDTNGHYILNVKPDSYVVTGLCYPYHRATTKRFKVKAGDIIIINFQLVMDKMPTAN
ncbi:hypothetical protein [Spirosoma sp. KNUC1025]|uniref:hypothetical protein n=1 Tax=Spirosoma sp. KNUC1025 TaxID=2894082 RepID=UPI0038631916|nr:hypothetical protein LN737_29415 [Spirosoma sp. KNUC1025]